MRTSNFLLLVPLALACAESDTKIVALSPDIVIAPEELDFGSIVKLYTVRTDVQILNTGRGVLDIESLDIEVAGGHTDVFTVSTEEELSSIGPGGMAEVEISFTPQNYVDYRARLLVTSDDEDEPVLALPINGSGVVGSTPDIDVSVNSIDFGTVDRGAVATGYVTISNVGDGDLNILGLTLEESPFTLVTDPSGQSIAGGGEFTVIVEYSPDDEEEGHNADIIIESSDPDEPAVTVVLLGGNGGDYEDPIADIDCSVFAGVAPPKTLALDGRLSDDPEDINDIHDLTFEWELLRRPALSRTYFTDPEQDTPELFIDVAGVYEVQLIVTDFNGVSSEPATCETNIVPDEELYIALSWDTGSSDLDLHLVPGGHAFGSCMDCFYCRPVPNWPNAWGTPIYALDNTRGYGPENINVKDPNDQSYHIRVHYFANHGGGATTATVSVYINKMLYDTFEKEIPQARRRWNVGYVTFDGPCTADSCEFTFTEEDELVVQPSTDCPDCPIGE